MAYLQIIVVLVCVCVGLTQAQSHVKVTKISQVDEAVAYAKNLVLKQQKKVDQQETRFAEQDKLIAELREQVAEQDTKICELEAEVEDLRLKKRGSMSKSK